MDNDTKATIEFIDGYLYSMSLFCRGCNFVPMYGAESLNRDNNIETSLIEKLGINNFSNLKKLEQSTLSLLLHKWLGDKLLEGEPIEKGISLRDLIYQHRSYLIEFIEDIVSSNYDLYSFSIEHPDYGFGTEALCFHGKKQSLYIYFGFSD